MALTLDAAVLAGLTERWDTRYENMAFRRNKLLGMMNKKEKKAAGRLVHVPIKTGYSAGGGARYADAYANIKAAAANGHTQREEFQVAPYFLYHLGLINNTDEAFSKGKDAITDFLSDEVDSCGAGAAEQVENCLFSDGFGTMATIKSATGAGPYVLTLTSATDAYKFQNNMILSSKVTPQTAGLDGGTAQVTAFDGIAGTVTVTASGGWTPAATHVIGLQATLAGTATPVTFQGLRSWITDDATALAASFNNVVRAKNPQGLAGHVIRAPGITPIDGINAVLNSISNFPGANSDGIFVNSTTNEEMMRQLDNRAVITESKGQDIEVLYESMSFMGPDGRKKTVFVAPACGSNEIWVLDLNTWTVEGPGNKFIHPGQPDGTPFVPLQDIDATLVKMRAEGYVYCDAPGFNGVVIR
jgi:hypothetical protein